MLFCHVCNKGKNVIRPLKYTSWLQLYNNYKLGEYFVLPFRANLIIEEGKKGKKTVFEKSSILTFSPPVPGTPVRLVHHPFPVDRSENLLTIF
jgi:hypothetical protein